MKRNQHPYVSASYVNGYVKDIPLRGINEEEVLDYMTKATQQFGRAPLDHNDQKVQPNGTSVTTDKPV